MSILLRFSSIFGNWRKTSKFSTDIDLEAQTITGTHALFTLPSAFEQAHLSAAPICTPEQSITTDPVNDFFGITRPRATRESRHDSYAAPNCASSATDGDAPPPYAHAELPAYTSTPVEPATLAMYLFKFGFLFPPFWLLGAVILLSPLSAPADFEPTKSEAERQELVRIMRDAEIKWAKRCAWALLVIVVAIGITAVVIVSVLRS